jgi:hypothetical protein
VPRAPETNGARGTNKATLWAPRTLTATASLAFIDAVLEFKYLKCLLVRMIFALVSIAKSRTICSATPCPLLGLQDFSAAVNRSRAVSPGIPVPMVVTLAALSRSSGTNAELLRFSYLSRCCPYANLLRATARTAKTHWCL